jgi:hypothetical protein
MVGVDEKDDQKAKRMEQRPRWYVDDRIVMVKQVRWRCAGREE